MTNVEGDSAKAGRLFGRSPKWRPEIPSACGPTASGFRGYHAKR